MIKLYKKEQLEKLKEKYSKEMLKEAFKEGKYDMIKCKINAGKAFDIEVDVYFWIMQKIK